LSRKGPEKPPKPATEAERRQVRLADALRANLKRRKAVGPKPGGDVSGKPEDNED
jgi:hypothetical protein